MGIEDHIEGEGDMVRVVKGGKGDNKDRTVCGICRWLICIEIVMN